MPKPNNSFREDLESFTKLLHEQWKSQEPLLSKELDEYSKNWENNFSQPYYQATSKELHTALSSTALLLASDFHPLSKSQEQFSLLAARANPKIIVLELLSADIHLKKGEQVKAEKLVNNQLLIKTYPHFFKNGRASYEIWGSWKSCSLKDRDSFACNVIERAHKHGKVWAQFGDWHIADKHLPLLLYKKNINCTTLHISPEPLWEKKESKTKGCVIKFNQNKWALVQEAPILRKAAHIISTFYTEDTDFYTEEVSAMVEDCAIKLAATLNVPQPESAFEIHPQEQWESFVGKNRDPLLREPKSKTIKNTIFHPSQASAWFPRIATFNDIIQASTHLLFKDYFQFANSLDTQYRMSITRQLVNICCNPFYLQKEDSLKKKNIMEQLAFRRAKTIAQKGLDTKETIKIIKDSNWDYDLQLVRAKIGVA